MRVSVWVRRDTVDRGSPQRLEISKLPSRASWPSKQRKTSNARDTTWITSPSPARSLASIPCLLSRSERRPMVSPFIPLCGIKFHLQDRLPQAICGHNKKPFARAIVASVGGSEVLFPVAASPSRELLSPTHTEIISF